MITDADIGRCIAGQRAERRMTQSQMREALRGAGVCVDPSAISRIESGQRTIRATELLAIAGVLGVEVSRLCSELTIEARLEQLSTRIDVIAHARICLTSEQDEIEEQIRQLRKEKSQ